MDKQTLRQLIAQQHENGKKVAVSFCSHVPQELLLAAGLTSLRVPFVEDGGIQADRLLPANLCDMVKNCCTLCQDEALAEADLVVAETSCDGKKKMYELISRQDRVWFYQIPQCTDREYVLPLLRSEFRYLANELEKRFGAVITDDALREAGERLDRERDSVTRLMSLQKPEKPAAWGREIYAALLAARELPEPEQRVAFLHAADEGMRSMESPVPPDTRRILVTGCPLSGAYGKVLGAVEENGGVVVCMENCEAMKPTLRHFDGGKEDPWEALAQCCSRSACAVMSPNDLRLELIQRLVEEYRVEGVIDVALHTCHPYTVEQDRLGRLCTRELGIPYIAIETDTNEADRGQLATRIAAFIEML